MPALLSTQHYLTHMRNLLKLYRAESSNIRGNFDETLGNDALVAFVGGTRCWETKHWCHNVMKSRCSDCFSMSRYHVNSPASKPCEVSAVSPFLQCPEALAEVRPQLPLSGHSIVYTVSDSLEISANEPPKSSPQSPSKEGVC